MKRRNKWLLGITTVLLIFLGLFWWFSPSLMHLIPGGKPLPDTTVTQLHFDTINNNREHDLVYEHDTNSTYLAQLRKESRFDTILKNAHSDFEKVVLINNWVHSRWQHDGDNTPEREDARYILQEAAKGRQFRCVEYGIVATACLNAAGLPARTLGLRTKDVEEVNRGAGHVALEVYLRDLHKWVFVDPQWDVIAQLDQKPLNAVELQDAIVNHKDRLQILSTSGTDKEEYTSWIGPYLYFLKISFDNRQGLVTHTSIRDMIFGHKTSLMLLPVGTTAPHIFQRLFRDYSFITTNSLKYFYAAP